MPASRASSGRFSTLFIGNNSLIRRHNRSLALVIKAEEPLVERDAIRLFNAARQPRIDEDTLSFEMWFALSPAK